MPLVLSEGLQSVKNFLRTVFEVTSCPGMISCNFTISYNFLISLPERVIQLASRYWVTIFMKMKKNVMYLQEVENKQFFELIKQTQHIICTLSCIILYMKNRNSFWREQGACS